ncbi:MAG: fibronectin type III domain-containing protein [Bdellovibrionaceae bacterium]|nr:fibronectin type III domain-containing protein [Pseudobdellovibrionaceae bacterium]
MTMTAQAANDHHDEHGGGQAHRDNTALFPQPKPDITRATPPAAPKLESPAFEAVINGDAATLKWQASNGATDYHVQVATDPNFKWLKAENHWVKSTSFDVSGLEKGKLYYWRVAAWKGDNNAATNKSPFAASSFETK